MSNTNKRDRKKGQAPKGLDTFHPIKQKGAGGAWPDLLLRRLGFDAQDL